MVQISMRGEYERGRREERERIIRLIESVDPIEFALAGEHAGADMVKLIEESE